jgi:polysaccharide biosynthesis/export protein
MARAIKPFRVAMTRGAVALSWVLLSSSTAASQTPAAGRVEQQGDPLLTAESFRFRLSPGDELELKFFYNPELNDTIRIQPDGQASLPLIGELEFKGKTIPDVTREIEERYSAYLKNPDVSIQVTSYASQQVYVGGEVFRPGAIHLVRDLTLLEAMMEVGGPTPEASRSEVMLIRKGEDGKPVFHKISIGRKDAESLEAAVVALRPSDVVIVPESGITQVNRWVEKYILKLSPITLTANFTYLLNQGSVVIP